MNHVSLTGHAGTVSTIFPEMCFVAKLCPSSMFHGVCVHVCVCVFSPCRGALTVRPSPDSQLRVRAWFPPTPCIFYNKGSVRNMQGVLSLPSPLTCFFFFPPFM